MGRDSVRGLVRNRYLIALWVASAVLVIAGASVLAQSYEQTMMQFTGFGGSAADAEANARSYALTASLTPLGGPLVALGLLGGLSTLMLLAVRTSRRR